MEKYQLLKADKECCWSTAIRVPYMYITFKNRPNLVFEPCLNYVEPDVFFIFFDLFVLFCLIFFVFISVNHIV